MIYAGYSVKALTEERIELVGPASPVSGVQVTKGYAFTGPGRLECTTTLTNVRDEAVAWGLWSNTRLEPGVPFYVACEGVSADAVRYDDPDGFRGSFPDGRRWYTIAASGSAQEVANKAYLPTQKPWIGIFQENWLWVKEIAGIDWRGVHPDHTSVEIFMRVGGAPERQLLELEFHGPHTEIAPGASISQTEAWTFHRAVAVADERERLELLERICGK
jgi:hypothetical protein